MCCASRCSTGWCWRRSRQQHADRAGIKISDEQVNAALEDIAKRQNSRSSSCPRRLAADGIDYAAVPHRAQARDRAPDPAHSATSCSASSSRRVSSISTWNARRRPPRPANEYNVSHILIAVAQDAKPAQLAAATQTGARRRRSRAQRRGLRQARGHLLAERDRARRRLARLAQGHGAADLPGGCDRPHEAGRCQRRDADAQRLSHREAQ